MMKSIRCFNKGCTPFFVYVIDAKNEKKAMTKIPVVCDFREVFIDDLLILPPKRHVEFRIDLLLSMTPVAKEPYRLAPAKMKELITQI